MFKQRGHCEDAIDLLDSKKSKEKGFKITCMKCGKETVYKMDRSDALKGDNLYIDLFVTIDSKLIVDCECGNRIVG